MKLSHVRRGGIIAAAFVLCMLCTVGSVFAATTQIKVPVKMQLSDAIAGAEFELELTPGLSFERFEKSSAIASSQNTPVVTKDGKLYFGFYHAGNAYAPDRSNVLDLGYFIFTYDGTDDQSVLLSGATYVRTVDQDKTSSKTIALNLEVNVPDDVENGIVIVADEVGGGSSAESGAGSGGSTGGVGTGADDQGLPFTDVPDGSWYYGAVGYVYQNGLMDGTSATSFLPNANTTRGMVVTTLWRLAGRPAASGGSSFADLTQDWYREAVAWAAENGIVNGYHSTAFGPDDLVTREQLAVMLYRYAADKDRARSARADLTSFADGSEVDSWAGDAVRWACGSGLITGRTGGRLDPKGSGTRAELATLLQRFAEKLK